MSIPISKNLESLYIFFYKEMVKANVSKDCTEIEKIIPMIADLRDAFTGEDIPLASIAKTPYVTIK